MASLPSGNEPAAGPPQGGRDPLGGRAVASGGSPGGGHLAENIVHFARVLREAGLAVGSERIQLSLQALQVAGLESRADFKATLAVSVGPLKARFKGRLKLSELDPPRCYQIAFEGQGGAAGHGKGEAKVWLEVLGPQQTQPHYAMTTSVGGKLAQVGSRLVDMAAQKMAGDFFAAFNAALQQRYAVAQTSEPAPPPKSAWQRFLDRYLGWLAIQPRQASA